MYANQISLNGASKKSNSSCIGTRKIKTIRLYRIIEFENLFTKLCTHCSGVEVQNRF